MRAQLDLYYKVIAVNNNNINAQMQVISGGNGLNLSKFNDSQTLLNAAEAYYYLGYSVIPLLGDVDPARPKVAARSWSVYQQRLANLNEFQNWFSPEGGAAALGIVTGRISRLVVLDFDSPDLFADFRRRFPDLLETRTVQSAGRGLPHLYFHLPPHLRLASHKRVGVDLLSDGRYVVAPPSTINDSPYRITRGGMPRDLTAHDIQRLQSFLSDTQSRPSPSIYKEANLAPLSAYREGFGVRFSVPPVGAGFFPPALSPIDPNFPVGKGLRPFRSASPAPLSMQWRGAGGEETIASTTLLEAPSHPIPAVGAKLIPPALSPITITSKPAAIPSRAALHGLYHYWHTKGGRNDALFRTALYARDHGMSETQTRHLLVSLHVSTPLSSAKPPFGTQWRGAGGEEKSNESPALRQREAHATIRSAFSRPPRRIVSTPSPTCGGGLGWGLPNSVREALMQRKQTCVVRTIEGLYQVGFRPGRGFTADQAIKSLKGIVGRDSVYNALNALAPNRQPIFPQRSPSPLPQASKEAARQTQPLKTKKCFFVTEKKSGIKKRGPKQRTFKFPTVDHLCKLLGVEISGSDPLTREDLASAHQTRMALQRELIKRRPGEYSYRWMANRLGVSRRTISTYNRLIPIHSQPTYHETVLSWTNIDSLLTDEILAGSHIETLVGKKYPALHSIACNLLAKHTYIRLKQRKSNFYWYGSDDPPPNTLTTVSPSVVEGFIPPTAYPTALVMNNSSIPSPSVGKGLRPFRPALTTTKQSSVSNFSTPSLVYGGGLGWGLPAPTSSPAPLSSAKPPFGTQWRGAGGEDAPHHAVSAPVASHTPLSSVGKGLRPVRPALTTTKQSSVSNSPPPSPVNEGGRGRGLPAPTTPDQQETLAQTIYTRVNQSNDDTTKQLSLKNARKLVRTHTEKDIQFALQRLAQRTNLANPTGFFVTVLRSTARANEF